MLMVALSAGAQVTDCTGQMDGTACTEMDDNVCTNAACDHESCNQQFSLQAPGTTCPDIDENTCTIPSCNAVGDCNQSRSRAGDGTECTDHGVPGHCQGADCVAATANPAAPTLSAAGMACLTAALLALGFWQMRRRSAR